MRTISGNPNKITESILGSVNAGKDAMIEKWMSEQNCEVYNSEYDKTTQSISFKTNKELRYCDIPVYIKRCKNLTLKSCLVKEFALPEMFDSITIENCPNLERLYLKAESCTGNYISITDCPSLKTIECDALHIKHVTIEKCNELTELAGFKSVEETLYMGNCKKLRNYNYTNEFLSDITIYRCPLKYFYKPMAVRTLVLDNILKTKDIDFEIDNASDVRIENCSELVSLKLIGKDPQNVIVSNNPELTDLTVECKPTKGCVLSNLPKLSTANLPERIGGIYIFKKLPIQPKVKGKVITK